MHQVAKVRGIAGLLAVVAGVALIGADGAAFVAGWALWAVGLALLLTAIPSAGGEGHRPSTVASLPPHAGGFEQRAA